jgi:hypothetical protein
MDVALRVRFPVWRSARVGCVVAGRLATADPRQAPNAMTLVRRFPVQTFSVWGFRVDGRTQSSL